MEVRQKKNGKISKNRNLIIYYLCTNEVFSLLTKFLVLSFQKAHKYFLQNKKILIN